MFGIININARKKKKLNESTLNKTGKSGGNTSGNKSGSTADNTLIGQEFELLKQEELDNLDTQHKKRK